MGIITEAEMQRYKANTHFKKEQMIPISVIDEIKAKIDFEEKWLMDVWHTDEKTNRRMRIDDIKVAMDGLRHFINEKVKEYET